MPRNNDYARRKNRGKAIPFVQLHHYLLESPAWRDLDVVARGLYVELRHRFNGRNNGGIALGCREAAAALGVGADTASRAFKSLEQHGFVRITTNSTFNQKRLSREWLLTELPDDRTGTKPTKEFMSWSRPKAVRGANIVDLRRPAAA